MNKLISQIRNSDTIKPCKFIQFWDDELNRKKGKEYTNSSQIIIWNCNCCIDHIYWLGLSSETNTLLKKVAFFNKQKVLLTVLISHSKSTKTGKEKENSVTCLGVISF